MEDRLAKSLRAAHDRHAQHLTAEQGPHADHHEHHVPAEEPAAAAHNQHVLDAHTAAHECAAEQQEQTCHQAACEHACAGHAETPAVVHVTAHEPHPAPVAEHPAPSAPIQHPAPAPAAPHASAAPAPVAAAPAHVAPAAQPVSRAVPAQTSGASWSAVKSRFAWQGGRVSIVGTLALSLLISSGLFSLQMIAKWRRVEPTESQAKAAGLDQPLTIATQDEPQPTEGLADASAPAAATASALAASPASAEPAQANSDDSAQRGLDEFFASNHKDATNNAASAAASGGRAPYSPDPVNVSSATASAAGDRAVTTPESSAERPAFAQSQPATLSGPPLPLPGVVAPYGDQTASASGLPSSPPSAIDPSLAQSPTMTPPGNLQNGPYGLSDQSGSSRQLPGPPAQPNAQGLPTAQSPAPLGAKNVNLVDWNRPASGLPSASPIAPQGGPQTPLASTGAPQSADASDAAHNSLDAPGPVIVPGHNPSAPNPSSVSGLPGGLPGANMTSRNDTLHADAAPLPDFTQRPAGAPASGVIQTAGGADPVTGLLDRRPQPLAPEATSAEIANPLAALDRTKVMSFQFRNAPWTVVLSQFAAETHLELRMQSVPQGVFNRWDAARYSPSQTLSILSSELARTGCQLKLEGSVLRVCPLSSTATASRTASSQSAVTPASWLPSTQSSPSVVPASGSGRY